MQARDHHRLGQKQRLVFRVGLGEQRGGTAFMALGEALLATNVKAAVMAISGH
jgi:hypothetical protein